MIYLRDANEGDRELVMAWHSHPLIYSGFYTIRLPLTWEEHSHWWGETTQMWKKLMVVLVEDTTSRSIGFIRISSLEDFSPQIFLTIGEISLWGKGYGKQVVSLILEWLINHGYKHTHTTILASNPRALKLLQSLGFEIYGSAREGEVWLQKKLKQ